MGRAHTGRLVLAVAAYRLGTQSFVWDMAEVRPETGRTWHCCCTSDCLADGSAARNALLLRCQVVARSFAQHALALEHVPEPEPELAHELALELESDAVVVVAPIEPVLAEPAVC